MQESRYFKKPLTIESKDPIFTLVTNQPKDNQMSESKSNASTGIGLGTILAILISVALNKSFWWAILHMFFGWFYVIYALVTRGTEIIPGFRSLLGI